ncbi:MAG: hypothetical protein K2N38_14760, partial [Oscillospiraceae bacterium]|nr:hypothetical protein [Oscillospiraceae bacterium]
VFLYNMHKTLEPVHIARNARISKRIFRITRKKSAGILGVFQGFMTKLCGKYAERHDALR